MPGDPRLRGQLAGGPLAGVANHHAEHEGPVSPGGRAADLHASLHGGQAGDVARPSPRAPDLPQHGRRWVQERSDGAQRCDPTRPALRPARRVHEHRGPAAGGLGREPRRRVLQGRQAQAGAAAAARPHARHLHLGLLGGRARRRQDPGGHGRQVPQAGRRGGGSARRDRVGRHSHRHRRARGRRGGVGDRPGPLPRGSQGPADPPAGDEGLGLALAPAAVGDGGRDGDRREPVLARPVPELQDHVPVPRGQLRAGRGRARALHRARLQKLHPRRAPERRRASPHTGRVRTCAAGGAPMITTLQTWVTRQAEYRPEATAVVLKGERTTYGELEAMSNRLARLLRKGGCATGDRVGLLIPKSPTAIAAIIGVLKAGGIYVPLDPASPPARLAKIVDSCEPRWILGAGPGTGLLQAIFHEERFRRSLSLGWLDPEPPAGGDLPVAFAGADLGGYPSTPPDLEDRVPDAAHILFTSGSTGTPKGVVVRHSSVIHFVECANAYFGATSADRNSGHAPLHFDLSTYDIFGTFAAGAQLHLVPPEINVLPNKLADFIRASDLTQWFSVPSALNYMAKFDVVKPDDFPALQRVHWCGEVLPTPALIYWMKRLPPLRFTNLYGPTEAAIASSYYTVPACPADETAAIPIGTACAGEELLVLDDRLEPVAPGEVGDLYIRGVGLSPGYWRDPERTAAVFLNNRRSADPGDRIYKTGDLARSGEDGLVYFLGRADSQIKSRGYRSELGEIEVALNAMPGLRECAVVAIRTEGFEGATICCAFVAEPGVDVTAVALRRDLAKGLPSYMLPARGGALDRLPQNAHRKIDPPPPRGVFQRRGVGRKPTHALNP